MRARQPIYLINIYNILSLHFLSFTEVLQEIMMIGISIKLESPWNHGGKT